MCSRLERELKPGGLARAQSDEERDARAARGEGVIIDGVCTGETTADDYGQPERTPAMGLCDEINRRLEARGLLPTCTHEQAQVFLTSARPSDQNLSQLDNAWYQIDNNVEQIAKWQTNAISVGAEILTDKEETSANVVTDSVAPSLPVLADVPNADSPSPLLPSNWNVPSIVGVVVGVLATSWYLYSKFKRNSSK